MVGEYTFYACNNEAFYKAHARLNLKRLRIIVICRQRLLRSGSDISRPDPLSSDINCEY
jgi:hypothetical protein